MANLLKIAAPPPRRPTAPDADKEPVAAPPPAAKVPSKPATKFNQIKEGERVQFNKRVTRRVADGFEMLAIRTRRKVPDLLAEALDLLENQYGKV